MLSEHAPAKEANDWSPRRRAKALLAQAEARGLGEAVQVHALSLYGRQIWSLSGAELDEIQRTFGGFCELLDRQLERRNVN